MNTVLALVFTALACALARPAVPTDLDGPPLPEVPPPLQSRVFFTEYILPHFLLAQYPALEESARNEKPVNENVLDKEIEMINQMKTPEVELNEPEMPDWMRRIQLIRAVSGTDEKPLLKYVNRKPHDLDKQGLIKAKADKTDINYNKKIESYQHQIASKNNTVKTEDKDKKTLFALTPLDSGYFDSKEKLNKTPVAENSVQKEDIYKPRETRQNPNLSKTKSLVAENLDRLRIGVKNKDLRIPVSLVPTNLRWLKINHLNDNEKSSQGKSDGTEKSHHIHVLETGSVDEPESIFSVALIAAVGAALTMALIGFGIGWYTLSKKAKAAADVDYPAYGVTGPTVDSSGDRKLAQSAHMYHYQHQKQQIIAMERSGVDQRNGSISDPESEEENEEGDYTVYECPGFATTGDLEVKNPLFQEDPTPATPEKCEVVQPQPKE